jgi:hypothetical protein
MTDSDTKEEDESEGLQHEVEDLVEAIKQMEFQYEDGEVFRKTVFDTSMLDVGSNEIAGRLDAQASVTVNSQMNQQGIEENKYEHEHTVEVEGDEVIAIEEIDSDVEEKAEEVNGALMACSMPMITMLVFTQPEMMSDLLWQMYSLADEQADDDVGEADIFGGI